MNIVDMETTPRAPTTFTLNLIAVISCESANSICLALGGGIGVVSYGFMRLSQCMGFTEGPIARDDASSSGISSHVAMWWVQANSCHRGRCKVRNRNPKP